MVLLSLLLQTILIIFGSRRKTTGRIWIRILVWSAYLSADMVATVALSTIARSQGDSSCDNSEKANNSIQAFWAPFLLLHLGGPDTITAYSIEDNELWLRHLLGLVVQVGVAFYVFLRSWDSGILSFIAIPMFVVGIAKYAERTWVLWSSCSKSLKNSSLSDFEDSYRRLTITNRPQNFQEQKLLQAYAFKVVEAELGLIYDMLYTKAPLIYSRAGIILRCISSLLSVTVFITFQVLIDKHDYSTTDIAITYLLFVAAVFLEFYAFLCLVLSDWTMIWLIDKKRNAPLSDSTYSLIRKLTRSKRWSRSISQYNLRSSSIENKPLKCLELLGMDEMMRQMHVNRKDLNVDLKRFIFDHLEEKAEKIKEDLNVCDKNHRSKIIDICYRADKDASKEYEASRCLSEYMMYLLVIRPNMLSKGFGDDEAYQATLRELRGLKNTRPSEKEYQRTLRELWGLRDEEYQSALRELRNSKSRDYVEFQRLWKIEKSVLRGVERLAGQLIASIGT
ncbi:hypothetical protein NC653_035281 [Populus alba x Populus x berolinensis]|uniref:DUF4220 domain-containing protein n=1 Tax=Populus alba x Populus x berolinensis TaxID=444605 RepID=A0AAD6LPP5_9ROSI|nr:hypothetical protein NC653_035281 [Populus alba x Populus x berolinensis]